MSSSETIEFAPNFSFKPINLSSQEEEDLLLMAAPVSPTEIFREMDVDNIQDTIRPCLSMCRAKPIEQQPQADTNESSSSRVVISPFPHAASFEEMEERDELTTQLGWKLEPGQNHAKTVQAPQQMVDFTQFFASAEQGNRSRLEVMDCSAEDDFSLSSCQTNDLAEDLCLEKIWEEGFVTTCATVATTHREMMEARACSPTTQVSLGSLEPQAALP